MAFSTLCLGADAGTCLRAAAPRSTTLGCQVKLDQVCDSGVSKKSRTFEYPGLLSGLQHGAWRHLCPDLDILIV